MKPTLLKKEEKLDGMVTVMPPEEAMQPILPPPVRGAVHQWMTEIRAEDELKTLKVSPRKSAILSGPPGCGKTTLAHHLAARLNYNLVCVHTDRLRGQYVGETGQNIAQLFTYLKGQKNSIIFFDEFDALATQRGAGLGGADQERNAIVNALLQRIEQHEGILIAATNMSQNIDAAIWRRFGMQLEIPMPGLDERFAIMKLYLDPLEMPEDDIDTLSHLTEGAAPSLLKQLIEGIKRDVVLAPRLNLDPAPRAIFQRIIASVKPHESYDPPQLWADTDALKYVEKMTWTLPEK